jgi:hypothetical protein
MHETAHVGSGQSERDARGDMARCRLSCCLLSGILTRGSQGALPPPTSARGVPRWVAHGMDIDEGDPLAPALVAAWQALLLRLLPRLRLTGLAGPLRGCSRRELRQAIGRWLRRALTRRAQPHGSATWHGTRLAEEG